MYKTLNLRRNQHAEMISRRNIRVKVMQTLYTADSIGDGNKVENFDKILKAKIEQSRNLFTYLIFNLIEIARYAELDAHLRSSKHLPSHEDLNVNTKIAGNQIVWKTLEMPSYLRIIGDFNFESIIDRDLIKKIYQELTSSAEYADYIENQGREKRAEKKILSFIFTQLMLPNEEFTSHVEEHFINWDDDSEQMETLVLNFLDKPNESSFKEFIGDDKSTFARDLLKTVLEKNEYTLELIKPKLKNWDADRIAALDMIILQMGVCEFLYFETIPTKVTINEYIDIAKAYSTSQSGQFINGLLDNLQKELSEQSKIHKRVYKNSTL